MLRVLDPLYGAIDLPDFAKDIVNTPELQRLSEIRLMNVPGPTMIGATTTTRLEHALGVAHLANICSKQNRLPSIESNNLILASLIHDVASYPYGHLVERTFKRLFPESPDHTERLLRNIYSEKEDLIIYRGAHCQLYKTLLNNRQLFGRMPILSAGLILGADVVGNAEDIAYEDLLGRDKAVLINRLISGPIDLDNIDNVFRIAHRFGIRFDVSIPERLAASFVFSREVIQMKADELCLLEEWLRIRSLTYEIFFTHPDILAMKALLTYCVEESVSDGTLHLEDWVMTDIQLLETFLSLDRIRQEARQILLGHELTCLQVFVCDARNIANLLNELPELRDDIATKITAYDKRKRKTDKIANLEREYAVKRLFVTLEYDKGATSRQFEVEAISAEGKVKRKTLGENSNRAFISIQIPNWYTVSTPNCSDVLRETIGKRIDCPPNKIGCLNGGQFDLGGKGDSFGKQMLFWIRKNS